MSFLSLPQQARKPLADVLPDGRKRLTRYFRITTTSPNIPPELNYAPGTHDPWPESQTPAGWTGLLLTYFQMKDSERGFPQGAEDDKPILQLIFEQIAATGETPTGGNDQRQLPDSRWEMIATAVQFSSQPFVPQTINSNTINTDSGVVCYLFKQDTDNDGTLVKITRTYQSAGTTETDLQTLQGGALLIQKISSFHTVPSTPGGYTLIGQPIQNPNGYPIYTYTYAKGSGLVIDESQIISKNALVTYHRLALGTAPTTPSATISGTVTLFENNVIQRDGYVQYDYRWAEGNGQDTITTAGHADSALDYTVVTYTLAASTPAYPGSGTGYLIQLTQTADNAYFRNVAVWRKPPPTLAYRKTMGFQMPGLAYMSGTQLILSPPVEQTILATVTVSYATSQTTTTPFSITLPASFYASWVPYLNPGTSPSPGTPPTDTDTAAPQSKQFGLGGYLAGAASSGGTNDYYSGVFCQTYSYTLVNSTPSSRPSGATTIRVENEDYLTDTSGTKVFRVTVITYSF